MNSQNDDIKSKHASHPEYIFQCRYCKEYRIKDATPLSTICQVKGKMHAWLRIAEWAGIGKNTYECRYCHETINAKSPPVTTLCSVENKMHAWQRQ